MKFYDVPGNFPKPLLYLDLQKLYSINFSDGKTRMNLKSAIDEQGIKGDEHYHSAMSDARYTAKIMKKLDFDRVKKFYSKTNFLFHTTPPLKRYNNLPSSITVLLVFCQY